MIELKQKRKIMRNKLISVGTNAKLIKGSESYMIGGLSLAPATLSGAGNACLYATPGCVRACLNLAGKGRFDTVQAARIRKTIALFADPIAFVDLLKADLAQFETWVRSQGSLPAARLNVVSDIPWERFGVPQAFPGIQFYGYTKYPLGRRRIAPNQHLTYSVSELPQSVRNAKRYLAAGRNVAIVFGSDALIDEVIEMGWQGYPALRGDDSDLRFLSPPGHVIALRAKGPARTDSTGFVRRESLRMAA